jgi:squalene-hopene/tetraprenyl-beta-curcumene cyclase
MSRFAALTLFALPLLAGDWNPRLAAEYLDGRQEKWLSWPNAKQPDGTYCVSCHTSIPYLLARPALRRALGESGPTIHETKLFENLRAHVASYDAKAGDTKTGTSVDSVLGTTMLALKNEGAAFSDELKASFERMWSLQIREGKQAGAWKWFNLDLDPWEVTESPFFGASLAALAVGAAPIEYRARPEIRERVLALIVYLREQTAGQTLHNRLVLLWASTKLPDVMPDSTRTAILEELWSKQQSDGGWTSASLGPFKPHATAPPATAGDSYATAFATFIAVRSGVPHNSPKLSKALDWLKSHQDKQNGFWPAGSMNKQFEPESMQIRFMQEAATGYAVAALLEAAH